MENLNLKKLWEVCNILSNKTDELSEQGIWIDFLGHTSEYISMEFDRFLRHYSFKIKKEHILVFNDDPIAYEDWDNSDFSHVPICLLSFSVGEIEKWMEEEIAKQLEQQEKDRIAQKEDIQRQIELLNKRLNSL